MSEQKSSASPSTPNLTTWVLLAILGTGVIATILFFVLDAVRGNAPSSNAAVVADGSEEEYTGTAVEPAVQIENFTLTDQTGQPFEFDSLRGRVVLLFFGFTHCPDFCPTTLQDFTIVKRMLEDDADDVEFVFVSVDGERDTPEVMATYISPFDNEFIGLTGAPETITEIGEPFGLTVERTEIASAIDYTITHTVALFLINRDGQLVRRIGYGTAPTVIAEQLRLVVEQ